MDAAANQRFNGQGLAKSRQDSNDVKGASYVPGGVDPGLRGTPASLVGHHPEIKRAYGFK